MVPGTRPVAPSARNDTAQMPDMSTSIRVRRRPSIRWSTNSWSTTMTAVLAAKARPSACVEMPPTSRPKAGRPVLSWP